MFLLSLSVPIALACSEDTAGRIVGFDAEGTLALMRVERDVGRPGKEIDLVVRDLTTGGEKERFVILTYDDDGDEALRARNWKAAEARIAELGIVVDPDLKPYVPILGLQDAVPVPGTDAVVSMDAGGVPGKPGVSTRVVRVHHGQEQVESLSIGQWHRESSSNSITYPQALWRTPKAGTVVVQTGQGCSDPEFHVVTVPTEPATTPPRTVWCRQFFEAGATSLTCRDAEVRTLPKEGLAGVEKLDLSRSGITDLAGVEGFPDLVALDVSGRPITDVTPLAGLSKLKRLNLEDTAVADLSPLSALPLTNLDLAGTKVSDLGPLATRTDLDFLDVEGTSVSDLWALADLDLTTLGVSRTQVATLVPIAGMEELRALRLVGTAVSDFSTLLTLPNLYSVTIEKERHSAVRAVRGDVKLMD